MARAVTKAEAKAEAPAPAVIDDDLLGALVEAGERFGETMSQDDMSIPFLSILQPLSPQVIKGEDEFIKGATASMLFNSVTKELRVTQQEDDAGNDTPVVGAFVIPLSYKASFIEWVPRNKGGGFVREYDVTEGATIRTARNETNQDIILPGSPLGTPGNQLSYTHTHFAFVVNDNAVEPVVISMSSTQVKPSKDWNALITKMRDAGVPGKPGSTAPRFLKLWGATTRRRSNEQGAWYIWDFKPTDRLITEVPGALKRAIDFVESIKAGEVVVDHSKAAEGSVNPNVAAGATDDEVPF